MLSDAKKNGVKINFIVFIWIILCNFAVQLLAPSLESIHFYGWSFFLINILFFLIEGDDYRGRFWGVLIGSLVGLFAAGMLSLTAGKLLEAGMSQVVSVMIPLTVCLFIIIVLHPVVPSVFNNCSFAFFCVSLIDASTSFTNMTAYMLSAVAGHFIVNIGTILVICLGKKLVARKG